MERLLTPRELAELTGLKLSTIYALSYRRRIPTVKLGNRLRFRVSDAEKWIKQGERSALHPDSSTSNADRGGR